MTNEIQAMTQGTDLGPVAVTQSGTWVVGVDPVTGQPLGTAPRGGSLIVTVSTSSGVLLAAPAGGFCYRLHRITYQFSATATAFVNGHTSGFHYALWTTGQLGAQGENLDGQICLEGLDVNVVGSGTPSCIFCLSYDVIPLQAIV